MEAERKACQGDCRRFSPPHLRLHPLLAFRQGPEGYLTCGTFPGFLRLCLPLFAAGFVFYAALLPVFPVQIEIRHDLFDGRSRR